MEDVSDLVLALEIDTEFVPGGVKHKRFISKSKPRPTPSKKRKRFDKDRLQEGQDVPILVEEKSSIPVEARSHGSPIAPEGPSAQNEEDTGTQIMESLVPEETVLIEIEELWDIEPSSIIGQGAFGTVRFERRRPLMVDHTQTPHTSVRAVKEIRKISSPDYMRELQAIAKFTQSQVCWVDLFRRSPHC